MATLSMNKNITGTIKAIVLIIALALFAGGVWWFGLFGLDSDQSEMESGGVTVDLVLSSLSEPIGKLDVFWDVVVPEEQVMREADPELQFPYGYMHAVAEPLDLIEAVTITNNTDTPLFLRGIHNEQTSFLDMPSRESLVEERATPIMLLPGAFRVGAGEKIKCEGRDLPSFLPILSPRDMKGKEMNNICIFETPIEISAGTSLTFTPDLFAVSDDTFGFGRITEDIFSDEQKHFVNAHIDALGGNARFVPDSYRSYDDVAQRDTLDIGGFIVADSTDEAMLSEILDLYDGNGDRVSVAIGSVQRGAEMRAYLIPDEPFESPVGVFSEDVLGMQIFLYRNDFWELENITGTYDENTAEMLKVFQREMRLAETGKFDEATMFMSRVFNRWSGLSYDRPEDEIMIIGFNAPPPHFRILGQGTYNIYRYSTSPSTLIERVSGRTVYSADGQTRDYEGGYGGTMRIINNTLSPKRCSVTDMNGSAISSLPELEPNGMGFFSAEEIDVSEAGIYQLRCDDRILEVEKL